MAIGKPMKFALNKHHTNIGGRRDNSFDYFPARVSHDFSMFGSVRDKQEIGNNTIQLDSLYIGKKNKS